MHLHKEAVVRLLRDDDPETVRMVKEQLALGGDDFVSDLKDMAAMDDELVSQHARDVLAEIACNGADEDFLLLCHFFHEDDNLERACWTLSQALMPGVEIEPLEKMVNQWGRQLLLRITGTVSNRERVHALADFMSEELGFRGNTDDYYLDRNSFLPSVIESRAGIPISLAILYKMVAGRAGMKVDGINLPGHFVARHGEVLFDPFHRGRVLTKSDCEEILARQSLRLRPAHLEPATSRQILLRVLANLLYVYDLQKDTVKHARINAWVKALAREQ